MEGNIAMKIVLYFGAICVCLFSFTQAASAAVFYVASSGSSTSPYNTWAKAATDPQVAIELAMATPGGPHQIWVKKGVYKPQFNPHTETLDPREYCFALRNNVGVYGGFAGTETSLEQRDAETNQTILSGDRGTADSWSDGTPIVDGSENFNPPPTGDPSQDLPVLNNTINTYHVIYNPVQSPAIDASALLNGFIVTGGNANHSGPNANGGGIYNWNSSPTLTNCTFSGNSAQFGGGMFNTGSPLLTNCTFSGNSAQFGGGMFNTCSPLLTNCAFSGNSAEFGGGMYNTGSPTLTNCTFNENSAQFGGGIYNTGFPTLTNCTFSGNSAQFGGGMANDGSTALTNCTFNENSAPVGGGIYGSGVMATSSIFYGNYGGEFSDFINFSVRYSIIAGDISGFGTGCSNSNPLLGSFGYYGGATNCYSISSGSPAINAGASVYQVTSDNNILIYLVPAADPAQYFRIDDGTTYNPTGQIMEMINSHDQRGYLRTNRVDIGSYEYGAIPSSNLIDSGDYNGDGTSDLAIFRESSGLWAVRGLTRVYFGSSSDSLVSGDYNGDGTTDIGIFLSSSGLWSVRGVTRVYFGSIFDLPVPGDYNGDGTCDQGIFRSSSGLWSIRGVSRVYFGGPGDTPVPGYYAGVGGKKIGIFRGGSGLWAIRGVTRIYFGGASDRPVPGDYDGTVDWKVGIFRPSSGLWAVKGVTRAYFGGSNDCSVPADYLGNGRDDIGVFRPSTGLWAVRGETRVYYGATGDIPVTR